MSKIGLVSLWVSNQLPLDVACEIQSNAYRTIGLNWYGGFHLDWNYWMDTRHVEDDAGHIVLYGKKIPSNQYSYGEKAVLSGFSVEGLADAYHKAACSVMSKNIGKPKKILDPAHKTPMLRVIVRA